MAVIGEVSLEGKIRGVSGVLPIVMEAKNQAVLPVFCRKKMK